ncbi:MAG: Ig-like domain-containing protein [Bacteroidales bacterium]|nr:Ig-like domain-containing protein [Bacteroidales bacterium]
MLNTLRLYTVLALLPLLLSCGCGKQGEIGYKIESISVSPKSLEMMVGDKAAIKAYPKPSVANTLSFAWETSNAAVAVVSDGLVEAVGAGEAVISVSYQGVGAQVLVKVTERPEPEPQVFYPTTMFDEKPSSVNRIEALETAGVASYQEDGLLVNKTGGIVKLNRFYALAERAVRYRISPSSDAVCLFRSSEGDFQAYVDVPSKMMYMGTTPAVTGEVPFLEGGREYDVEITHIYQQQIVRITDIAGGQTVEISAVNDGEGGCGQGKINNGFYVGPGWDHYCFGLQKGSTMLVNRITVESLKDKVRLLIYGDSITQPECYYPTAAFPEAYTQLLLTRLGGSAMSSGRGGGNINTVLEYLPHELPYIKADYVMVTVGTNGGNTEANLTQLIEFIRSCGSTPILNSMPCNESGTQNDEAFGGNPLIRRVRAKLGVKGADLDKATSLAGDGKQVDKSMMYWEDYTGYPAPMTGWQIYHHPNPKGGRAIYEQILLDLPEIFE